MAELTETKLAEKYGDLENKIPGTWSTYESAGQELAQDLCFVWDIVNPELCRIIGLIDVKMIWQEKLTFNLGNHIMHMMQFAALYPEKMETFDIKPNPKVS